MSGKKIFGSTKILEPKIFWVKKKNLVKIFGAKKNLGLEEKFWVEKFLVKEILDQRNFG